MSKGLKITGAVLLAVGILIGIIGIVVAFSAMALEEEEETYATGNDFTKNNDGDYVYELNVDSLMEFYIKIESKSSTSSIRFDLTVEDELGYKELDMQGRTTPIDVNVDVGLYDTGYWEITIDFEDDNTTMSAVDVKVYDTTISDTAAMMCCLGSMVPILGVILLIVGIILLIVGFTRKEKSNVPTSPVFNQPQGSSYGGYQSQQGSAYGGYPSQSGSYGGYPPQTGSYGGGQSGYGGYPPQGGSQGGYQQMGSGGSVSGGNLPPQSPGPKVASQPPGYTTSHGGNIRTTYNNPSPQNMNTNNYR
ncbi:MAG: hypothetical protein ACMUIG_05440 [Thermoplasmatota archaeon]